MYFVNGSTLCLMSYQSNVFRKRINTLFNVDQSNVFRKRINTLFKVDLSIVFRKRINILYNVLSV